MGYKIVRIGLLRPARSRQDESKEVREVGSKRTSSGQWEGMAFSVVGSQAIFDHLLFTKATSLGQLASSPPRHLL
jgi:hypothetical protein